MPGDDDDASSAALLARFNAEFLPAALANLPPDVQPTVTAGLCKTFDNPPVASCEMVLSKRLTAYELRHILFFPSEDDAATYYPLLISPPPDGAGDDHAQFKALAKALSQVFLVHSRSWESFMRPYILGGGLTTLLMVMGGLSGSEPRLMARSQAMNVFYRCTNEDLHYWHDTPAKTQTDDRRAHEVMLSLHGELITALVANKPPSPFPGASEMALRILAWYLGWVRHRFGNPKERPLRLSSRLLATIREWAESAAEGSDEKELGIKLHDDFGRFGAIDDSASGASSSSDASETPAGVGALEVDALKHGDDDGGGAKENHEPKPSIVEVFDDDPLGMD